MIGARSSLGFIADMTIRRVWLILGIASYAVAAISAMLGSWLLGCLSASVGIIVLILQFRDVGGAVVVPFEPPSWVANEDGSGVHLDIPRRVHRRRSPVVTVYLPADDGQLQEVACDIGNLPDGTVRIVVSRAPACAGEVRIA
jgi:hypothetical protein